MGIPPYLRPTYPWLAKRRFAYSLLMSDPPDPSYLHKPAFRARRSLDAHQGLITFPHTAPGLLQGAYDRTLRARQLLGALIMSPTSAPPCGRTYEGFKHTPTPRSTRGAYP